MPRVSGRIIGAMTHGKQLVKALQETLPDNLKWTTEETITLGDIEHAGDRLEVLRARFATSAKDPAVTLNQLAVGSAEIRLLEDADRPLGQVPERPRCAADGRLQAASSGRSYPLARR